MRSLYVERLLTPLSVTLYTTEGRLLGHFSSRNICHEGLFVEGDVSNLMDYLRLLDMTTCILELDLPHRRPIRSTVRVNMHGIFRQKEHSKIYLRFVRIGSDYRRRYDELLYHCPAASL